MASMMSKRQQARNEKALHELVLSIPGNNFCADCSARNPSWASWNLGVFLCMRCAAIHRKLGTHVSKVKSLSMDSWTNDQVETMKRVGNIASNKVYNPDNKKPPVPIDADEADSAMERFIRAKYTSSPATNGTRRHTTGSTESDEGTPPPLPPKTGGKFGLNLSFRSKKSPTSPTHPRDVPERTTSALPNKPSKVFGASVGSDSIEDTARKLTQLRDMGFGDDRRNAMILKGVNGNVEKAIETLVRLGEGNRSLPPLSLTSPRESSLPVSRTLTPTPMTPTTIGLSKSSPTLSRSPATSSNNPWDIPSPKPQSNQSTGTNPSNNPFYVNSTNPFDAPPQSNNAFGLNQSLNQSLQNLTLAPQQPLFPHHTGGAPATQPQSPAVYQQPLTPPVPQTHNFPGLSFSNHQTYPQPVYQQQPQQSYNPFLQTPAAQQQLSLDTSPTQYQGGNPFARSPTRIASPALGQIPEQSQPTFFSSPQVTYGSNPFFAAAPPQAQPIQQQQQQQQPQQMVYQQPVQQGSWYESQVQPQHVPASQATYPAVRQDKASIMALYNSQSQMQPQQQTAHNPFLSSAQPSQGFAPQQAFAPQAAQQPVPELHRSATVPLPATNNPFLNGGLSAGPQAFGAGPKPPASSNRSRESMTLGMEMAWNNGRHSPDAFASLSARTG